MICYLISDGQGYFGFWGRKGYYALAMFSFGFGFGQVALKEMKRILMIGCGGGGFCLG